MSSSRHSLGIRFTDWESELRKGGIKFITKSSMWGISNDGLSWRLEQALIESSQRECPLSTESGSNETALSGGSYPCRESTAHALKFSTALLKLELFQLLMKQLRLPRAKAVAMAYVIKTECCLGLPSGTAPRWI
eukprot:2144623-Amphidinium_carterae.1